MNRTRLRLSAIVAGTTVVAFAGCIEPDLPPATQNVFVGALLPVTGRLSSIGEAAEEGLAIARADVNAALAAGGSPLRIQVLALDTASDGATALEALRTLSENGVTQVIGPFSSDELSRCSGFAERVGMVLLSPAATSRELGAADRVFRFMPDSGTLAAATASLLRADQREAVVLLADRRGGTDAWIDTFAGAWTDLGGVVAGEVRYDQAVVASGDFTTILDELAVAVDEAVADFGSDGVAVQLVSFEEGIQILRQADDDLVSTGVAWYGTDGMTLNDGLVADAVAASVAARVGFTAGTYDITAADRFAEVNDRIETELGREAQPHGVVTHDTLSLLALTLTQMADPGNADAFAGALAQTAPLFTGGSGPIDLDANGDRTGDAVGFYAVTGTGTGEPAWQLRAGASSGVITYAETVPAGKERAATAE